MMSLIFFHLQEVRNQNWIFPKKKRSHSVEYKNLEFEEARMTNLYADSIDLRVVFLA